MPPAATVCSTTCAISLVVSLLIGAALVQRNTPQEPPVRLPSTPEAHGHGGMSTASTHLGWQVSYSSASPPPGAPAGRYEASSMQHLGIQDAAAGRTHSMWRDGDNRHQHIRRELAACIAGATTHFHKTQPTMYHNVLAPLSSKMDIFLSVPAGSLLPKLLFRPTNISFVREPQNASKTLTLRMRQYSPHAMTHTLQACLSMIEHAEHRYPHHYHWVIRLRTDGVYLFTWNPHSSWRQRRSDEPVVFSTHCMAGPTMQSFTANDCALQLPLEQPCVSDQFAVLSRGACAAYFNGFLSAYEGARLESCIPGWTHCSARGNVSVLTEPPECVLGAALSGARVAKRALKRYEMRSSEELLEVPFGRVSGRDAHMRAFGIHNWGPFRGTGALAELLQAGHPLPTIYQYKVPESY